MTLSIWFQNNKGIKSLSAKAWMIMKEYSTIIDSKRDYNMKAFKFSQYKDYNAFFYVYRFSYMFLGEYDMYEWNLGHTFDYAEMAALIAPRPFMVERGHYDGVARDQWVGFEFAKVRRHYDLLGLPKSTRIEYFVGPHTIHGVGTFQFLDHFLKKE